MRRCSGYIQIDVQELLDELDDNDLLEELQARKLSSAVGETCDLTIVQEAYAALQRNALAEAKIILDRLLFPKWKTRSRCRSEYQMALKMPA